MKVRMVVALMLVALGAAACGSSGSKSSSSTKPTDGPTVPPTASGTPPTGALPGLTVLVTNDDGYSAPGINTMVEALRKIPQVHVTVVAPLTNQSGTGGKTNSGILHATKVKTQSGYPATAVKGYPADSVRYAFTTVLGSPPDLVVSGINNGANIGPLISISGTVGAAQAAANLGVPAIAVSQGAGNPPNFAAAASIVVAWIGAHRSEYNGAAETKGDVVNINVPTCTKGSVRGIKQVPAATGSNSHNPVVVDCTSTLTSPADDVSAFLAGFATITDLDTSLKTVTATTAYTG